MSTPPPPALSRSAEGRHFKYYALIMAGFVTVLLCSNLIGPGKSCAIDVGISFPMIGPDGFFWTTMLVFGAGNIFFPISYIFGDVLTEVYGYARARKVIWAGFAATTFATVMSMVVIALPVNKAEPFNEVYVPAVEIIFGPVWRIVLASMLAFWVGDFLNSYVMAKMKVWTKGRFLWMRTIGSTIVGQGADSLIFYPLAFWNLTWLGTSLGITLPESLTKGHTTATIMAAVLFNWFFKVMIEVVMTPVTYAVVGWLKRAEGVDHFDTNTDFTPFSLKD